ncbi:hypothetical protein [Actinomyces faecalis]|uniref:hypothetical protein n=1 Tax=Actinomyces faecalis TaxID=2722820 RepID=UPI001555B3AE|nr:hypothetical protein [Actinomyces faecalis]
MTAYTTRNEAIDREIIPAIEAGEASASEYDIDAIADEVLYTTGEGAGYRYQVTDDTDAFWAAVQRHAL